jgi:uncharacterized protein (DUF2252 family)
MDPDQTTTVSQRVAWGKQARKLAPRSSHRAWDPPADRPSPRRVLARQDESRVPELVPIRYERMLASPFSFFRGAAAIMAGDLSGTPTSALEVQLCGDAHLANFGVFAAPDRSLVFDINDFDETLPGPFEWDVKRLAASIAVAGGENGLTDFDCRTTALAAVREYREAMRGFAGMRDLDVWYTRFDVETVLAQWRPRVTKQRAKVLDAAVAKAHRKDSMRALARLTHEVDGAPRIVSDPPLIVPVEDVTGQHHADRLQHLLAGYQETLDPDRALLAERYRYVHAARKVVGVGSVGTEAWIMLLLGRDPDDPLFLQAKEAQRSVLEPFWRPSRFDHQGQRVVEGQRLMQAASDVFLGWVTGPGHDATSRDFYVRQLWDGKLSVDVESLGPTEFERYGRMCGWTLARAHARSGDRIAIASYLGAGTTFDEAIADFAEAYADQNRRDLETVART